MAQSNIKIAYLTQVPGGVWRTFPMPQPSEQQIRSAAKLKFLEHTILMRQWLTSRGFYSIKDLPKTHYKTFYKFTQTLK